ncbi:unnamed protein product [Protopolystoma xenopodis]|uniref:Uncharacterized protein n=1 Tax=Protopolystoma xenopodis TaxID=117903 RepID=A0A3S5AJ36_9PLAT|nr:unnamed protein product [Protopolystoma xenopodis]
MTMLNDNAGETSGNVPRAGSDFGNDHAYNGLPTRRLRLNQKPHHLALHIGDFYVCQPPIDKQVGKKGSLEDLSERGPCPPLVSNSERTEASADVN